MADKQIMVGAFGLEKGTSGNLDSADIDVATMATALISKSLAFNKNVPINLNEAIITGVASPTQPTDLTTKAYVDAELAKLRLTTADTLTVNQSIILAAGAKITGLQPPTLPEDPSTKAYVDAQVALIQQNPTLAIHLPARVATTADLGGVYDNTLLQLSGSSNGAFPTVDGVTLVQDDRILVKNQSSDTQNGIYRLHAQGSGSAKWVLKRADDFDSGSDLVKGTLVFVKEGTTYGPSTWTLDGSVATIGSSAVTFTFVSGKGGTLSLTDLSITGTASIGGATSITGATSIGGNLTVNTNKLIVNGTTGATAVAGTFDAAGATTLASSLTVAGSATLNGQVFFGREVLTPADSATDVNPSVSTKMTTEIASTNTNTNISGVLSAPATAGFEKRIIVTALAATYRCDIAFAGGVSFTDVEGTTATGKTLRFTAKGQSVHLYWNGSSWFAINTGCSIV